jgi:hypothetical protein
MSTNSTSSSVPSKTKKKGRKKPKSNQQEEGMDTEAEVSADRGEVENKKEKDKGEGDEEEELGEVEEQEGEEQGRERQETRQKQLEEVEEATVCISMNIEGDDCLIMQAAELIRIPAAERILRHAAFMRDGERIAHIGGPVTNSFAHAVICLVRKDPTYIITHPSDSRGALTTLYAVPIVGGEPVYCFKMPVEGRVDGGFYTSTQRTTPLLLDYGGDTTSWPATRKLAESAISAAYTAVRNRLKYGPIYVELNPQNGVRDHPLTPFQQWYADIHFRKRPSSCRRPNHHHPYSCRCSRIEHHGRS